MLTSAPPVLRWVLLQGMFIANQVDDAAMGATKSYTDFLQVC